jgi:hypothetical protein
MENRYPAFASGGAKVILQSRQPVEFTCLTELDLPPEKRGFLAN